MKLKLALALLASTAFASQAQEPVSFPELLKDYQGNVLAADSKYAGKSLSFNAKAASVEKSAEGGYYLSLEGAKRVRCYFVREQLKRLSELKKGDDVALNGVCKGLDRERGSNHLVFEDCRFGLFNESSGAAQALAEAKGSLFILSGGKGSGSGFAASVGGELCVVSSFHVFEGNDGLKIVDCENREVEPKAVKFAPDRDIVLFELPDRTAYKALELQPGVSSLPIGSIVRNYGNSAGAGVFTELGGKVLGVGPTAIEVDAPFVGGNSGSPVLSSPSMKVLGVASYATFERGDWVMEGTRFAGTVRRYATRLDNLDPAKLELYEKAKFDAELKALRSLEDLLVVKAAVVSNLKGVGNGKVSWSDFQLYAGKIPDSSKKLRVTQLVQQWNKELAGLESSRPARGPEAPHGGSSKSLMDKSNGQGGLGGFKDGSTPSLQKIPYDDLDRLLFVGEPKPKFSYKLLQERADVAAAASEDLRKRLKAGYENVKALLRN